jgi:hypothetical protein
VGAFLAGCAGLGAEGDGRNLTAGQSTSRDVIAAMGTPAETQKVASGETVLWYPKLPYGRVSYAARIAPDDHLIAVEQRLTERNISHIVRGQTGMKEVRELLGPPWRPERYLEREAWTYPMRIEGSPNPKWFVVQMSFDGIVRETQLMDDPQFLHPDSPHRR